MHGKGAVMAWPSLNLKKNKKNYVNIMSTSRRFFNDMSTWKKDADDSPSYEWWPNYLQSIKLPQYTTHFILMYLFYPLWTSWQQLKSKFPESMTQRDEIDLVTPTTMQTLPRCLRHVQLEWTFCVWKTWRMCHLSQRHSWKFNRLDL